MFSAILDRIYNNFQKTLLRGLCTYFVVDKSYKIFSIFKIVTWVIDTSLDTVIESESGCGDFTSEIVVNVKS